MIRSQLFVALLLLGVAPALAKTQCQEKPADGKARSMWREIDGRKCWYVGDRLLPKSELAWSVEPNPAAEEPDETEAAEHIVMVRVRVEPTMHPRHMHIADGLVDLMRPQPLETSFGLGAEWRIPLYRYSER
jgi:hypothetical protein